MTRFNTTFTALAAALLLSGTAFAAGVQPAAGEGPFFQAQDLATTSTLQRAQVRDAAIAHAPLAGNLPVADRTVAASDLSRAQVRAEAIAHKPAAGLEPLFSAVPTNAQSAEVNTPVLVKTPVASISSAPVAGNLPFAQADVSASDLSRAQVRAQALDDVPAAGEFTAYAEASEASSLSRAQVRAQTRAALANGFHVQSGNFS